MVSLVSPGGVCGVAYPGFTHFLFLMVVDQIRFEGKRFANHKAETVYLIAQVKP